MFIFLHDLPAEVFGLEARGPITHEDYQRLEAEVAGRVRTGPIRVLYVLGPDVSEYSPHALWDDQMFGIRHWRDFSQLALVTDLPWARAATKLFAPLFPGTIKVFDLAQLAKAKAWISAPEAG